MTDRRRTGLKEVDDSESSAETKQTDYSTRVNKESGIEAIRSHTPRLRFATPDASVELGLTQEAVRQSSLIAESPETSISSSSHVSVWLSA